MNRRSFLWTTTALSLAGLMSGCESNSDLKILMLQSSIPVQLIGAFNREFSNKNIALKPQSNLYDLYELLLKWQDKNNDKENSNNFSLPSLPFISSQEKIADLVTLGNYWLTSAIENKLIAPLDRNKLTNWSNLPPIFQKLVTRNNQGNLEENGQVWGAPYRWGCTMIAYREDKFRELGFTPEDWSDLWRAELKEKISLLNQPREIIGLILKKLGHSYNTKNLGEIENLQSELNTLHQQVKFYDSKNYLQPLVTGDTWLAVGWSTDIISVLLEQRNIRAFIPTSGTSLWADIWVNPLHEELSQERLQDIYQWIDFCWEEDSATRINLFTNSNSPVPAELKNNDRIPQISLDSLENSEFIEPLNDSLFADYFNFLN